MKNNLFLIIVVLILIGGGLYFYTNKVQKTTIDDTKIENPDTNTEAEPAVTEDLSSTANDAGMETGSLLTSGSYEVYTPEKLVKADEGSLVLFFRAVWCPTCKALDDDIKANQFSIPNGVTILDVDYDKYTDLKKKYGVTYQHTMVQVDADGKLIKKWSGNPTLASLIKEIK